MVNFSDELWKNLKNSAGLVCLLLVVFFIFGLAGSLSGTFVERVDQVRSLGDPRAIYPLAFIYFMGIALVLFSAPGSERHEYFLSICQLAASGTFFFFSLVLAYRVYFYDSLTLGVFIVASALLIVSIVIDAASRHFENRATNRLWRAITALVVISASLGIFIP